ncbi:alpha-2-macroglobulin family protein [Pleionea sediminis]|uniref:alpha-2-macroglobulin family protein n=1 Tax=Pleionea sediminis TaxID=2569479 RepID=UPI0011852C7A|nr:alpha-2-macroglobulin [Pleionea sediminis]
MRWLGILLFSLLTVVSCNQEGEKDSSTPNKAESRIKGVNVEESEQSNLMSLDVSKSELDALKEDFSTTPFRVLRIGEQIFDGGPALAVTFSVPVDPKLQLKRYISISTDKREPVSGDWILGENLNVAYFPFIQPETRYQVNVQSGLPALNGRILQQEARQTVLTSRKQVQVRFVSQGAQLSPKLSDGLTVEAINVEAIDIDFHQVKPEQLNQFLQDYLGNSYYELNRIKQYSSLVYSARYDLNYQNNKKRRSLLPLNTIQALQNPGIFIAVMKPAGDYPYNYQVTWFSVSDIGFQLREYSRQVIGFTHQVETAEPSSGVKVSMYDKDGRILHEKKSNEQGFVTFDAINLKATIATAERDGQLSIIKMSAPAMDLSEFKLPSREQNPMELFLYSPRDLYRPGEEAVVNGILRDNDGRLIEPQDINVEIKMPDGRNHSSLVWRGDAAAFYSYQFSIPTSAATGDWTFRATLGNDDVFNYTIKVEEFLPERMKLLVTSEEKFVDKKSSIKIDLQGDYLYGAPAAGNRVQATIISRQARTIFDEWEGFRFGIHDYRDFDFEKDLDPFELDNQGKASLSIDNLWSKVTQPMRVTTRVSLFESGGRPVARSINHIVWPNKTLIGIRPTWDGPVASPNSEVSFELINVNPEGKLENISDIDITLIREDAQYYWQWNDGWNYQQSSRNIPVYNRVINLEEDSRSIVNVPVDYGNYRIEARNKNNTLLASYRFFSGWRWDRTKDGTMGRPDRVTLRWDKENYKGDENARLKIESPYDGLAIVTVEANELLWFGNVEVKDSIAEINIPINSQWNRHDIYTSVNVIRAGDAKRKYLPKRAVGLLHLPLNRSERKLDVVIEAPEKILPESELETKVSVPNAAGKSINVTLAAVDTGVLSLSAFETPKPHDWFFAPRGYNTEIRDTWGALIEQLSDKRARQRFGGDSDELSRGGDAPQSDVQVISLYSGKVTLDNNGIATIKLNVPYFNGELRLMALAFSDESFGHQEKKVKVAAPLIAEVGMPRFLALGDTSNATFDVQNLTDVSQTLKVIVSASEALGESTQESEVTLEPQQKKVIQLPIAAKRSSGNGQVSISITDQNENADSELNLNREWNLGLRSPYPAELRQWNRVIQPDKKTELPKDFNKGLHIDSQHLVVTMSPKPPLDPSEHLAQLIQYPYGCLEQTSSRAWPLLLVKDEQLNRLDTSKDKKILRNRKKYVNDGISRILSMQRSDGGFGLWSNQSPESHWLTVFATDFLLKAKDYGYSVDESAIDKAMERLQQYLTTQRKLWSENNHYSQWPDHYHVSYRAYAALVLAERQQAKLSDVRNLFDKYHKDAKTRLPLAQLALALELTGDVRRSNLAWQTTFSMGNRPEGYPGDYGSKVRDMAKTMTLASQSKLVKDPWQLIFDLRDELIDRRWLSTQERFSLFELSEQLNQSPQSTWTAIVNESNEEEYSLNQTTDWLQHYIAEEIPESITLTNTSNKNIFLSMAVQGYPIKPPKPIQAGIMLERSFYNTSGKKLKLASLKTGDLLLVRIDVRSERNRRIPDGLIVDLLPAGWELENQNLESAVKMDTLKIDNKEVAQWMAQSEIKHQEYRDDRFVAAVDIQANRTTTVFYLARAVTPGIYNIPPTLVEDMYRPYLRAIGKSENDMNIQEN